MAYNQIEWGLEDSGGYKGYAGVTLDGTGITPEQAGTFVDVLAGLSDGGKAKVGTNVVSSFAPDPLSMGENAVGRRGTVIIRKQGGVQKWAISIPAIADSNIQNDGGQETLTAGAENAVKVAFETMTGLTVDVVRSFVTSK